jgi:hypothetical protein
MGARPVINDLLALALDMTSATVWYVGARVNAADRPWAQVKDQQERPTAC